MSIYTVTVIPQNLRREETVIQIAESLNYLSDVADDIFKRVNNRLEVNSANLNNIKARIDKVESKISNLSCAKSAIQVFSSSKYPVPDTTNPYETIFQDRNQLIKRKFSMKYKESPAKEEPLEKLQFYHITNSYDEKVKSEGLGDVPVMLGCINDFLLYNSGKNPYRKYVITDTLCVTQFSKKPNVSEKDEISAAPLSISDRSVMVKVHSENYHYSPDLGEVPAIDVPIDLPDLPGIADNLRYTDDAGPGIAPSVTANQNASNLPPHVSESKPTEEPVLPVIPQHVPSLQKSRPSTPEAIPVVESEIAITEPNKPKIVEEIVEIVTKDPITEPEVVITEIKQPPVEASNLHANLMDAIRKAGGAKNAKLRTTEPKENSFVKRPSGGDLMGEFHAKLSLRRKGISGAKKFPEWSAGSVMERISEKLIPPPTTSTSDQSESDTTNEEWD